MTRPTPQSSRLLPLICAMGAFLGSAQAGEAGIISWTDWTANTPGALGSASGTLGSVAVTYSGEVNGNTQTNGGGTNYWVPINAYLSATVGNAPPGTDIITLIGGNATVNTITFSLPLLNPVMAILSLGQGGVPVDYNFDQPFTILSFGLGFWGNGTLADLGGNVLQGVEGHGVIQFSARRSSISWHVPNGENWHGFTVGAPVPEPTTAGLLALALAGFAAVGARRRSTRS